MRSTDLPVMRWLLNADLDEPACPQCGGTLNRADDVGSVRVVGEDWSVGLGPGGDEEATAAFRTEIRGRLRRHLDGIVAELALAGTDDAAVDVAYREWTRLTAEAVAAYELRVVIDQPSVHRATLQRARLDRCQAMALLGLAAAAVEGGPGIDEALDRHIAVGLVSPDTATYLSRHRDTIDWSATSPPDRWTLSAVVAAAAAAAGLADPNPGRTAEAYVGWRWAELAGGVQGRPWLVPGPAALGRVLSDDALADVARRLYAASTDYRPQVERILTAAGRPNLISRVAAETASQKEASLQALLTELDRRHAADSSTTALARNLYVVLQMLRAHRRDDDLLRVGRHALALSDGTSEARATLLAVLGSALKDARRPAEFLALAGARPRDWEAEIRPRTRVSLVVERSNSLRLTGRADLALDALLTLDPTDLDDLGADDRRRLRRNIAMLRRETGAADAALGELTELLLETVGDDERFEVLQSLANVAQFLGNAPLALTYLNQALHLATGPRAKDRLQLTTSLATTQAALGLPLTDLRPVLAATDPLTILAAGAAAAAALEHDAAGIERDLVEEVLQRLADIAGTAAATGDLMVELNALRGRGAILDVVNPDAAYDVWSELVQRRGADSPDPLELAALAHHHYRAGHPDHARDLLLRIPDALAIELGSTTDISTVLDATGRLKAKFRLLGDDVLAADPPHPPDIRLVAELRRDALGQMRARARHRPAAGIDPAETSTTSLALADGHLWVLEWLDTTPGILGLLTRMDPTGRTTIASLLPVAIDPVKLAGDLKARLNGWLRTNPRDPFDHPEWNRAQDWLRSALADAVPGDHLVIIEHEAVSGLPWHAMSDTVWTISYAAGWTAMVRARALPRPDVRRVGQVTVPALRESPALAAVFQASRAHSQTWCQHHGLDFETIAGPEADGPAALRLLRRCDIATFHCHGLFKPDERDIALMLAHNQQLPPQRAHDVEQLTGHQLSWRDLQHLDTSPAVVLSAACSSGTSVVAGLGERLGLYGALRHAGTRTVIAPAWDAHAADVVHQLDQVRDRIIAGEPAARAVKAVADHAAAAIPAWRARILAVDGDWT